jgi:hypothetical protein
VLIWEACLQAEGHHFEHFLLSFLGYIPLKFKAKKKQCDL